MSRIQYIGLIELLADGVASAIIASHLGLDIGVATFLIVWCLMPQLK